MILVDTSIWVEAFADRSSPATAMLDNAMDRGDVVVGDLILFELLQGLKPGPRLRLVAAAMKALPTVTLCGPDIAPRAAENYRRLRSRGITIRGTIDVIIATWCIENRAALLHNDRDFDAMQDHLGLIGWR